ncbi:MAG TPA: GntR family transcriptional regulator [Rhizobiaceae bacterium]|nr:GntR family transcriptional regulator [Rhizobiaceae bacterium]
MSQRPDSNGPATSLHAELLEQLREYIAEGNLADGMRIPERILCEKFQISRTPLREALKVLAAEGLIELLPNRGARVRRLSERELRELFDLMGGLEALAGRIACERISEEEIQRIEKIHQEMYFFYLRKDLHEYFRRNREIHEAIVRAAGNQSLSDMYTAVYSRVRRSRYTANTVKETDRWSAAMREHELILDALRRRAGAELSEILFMHLRNKFIASTGQMPDIEDVSETNSSKAELRLIGD